MKLAEDYSALPGFDHGQGLFKLEARVGIEPASTALQAAA
jgi:hypothetical protein